MNTAAKKIFTSSTLGLIAALYGCSPPPAASTGEVAPLSVHQGAVDDHNPAKFDPSQPYRPDFDAADTEAEVDNVYNPLPVGAKWSYRLTSDAGEELIHISVQPGTKKIYGFRARIVRDIAFLNGKLLEDTTDWFGQDDDDNVWYVGEATIKYDPAGSGNGSTAGSWQAGKNGALPGVVMLGKPLLNDAYRQEYLKGQAEDYATIVDLDATVTVPAGTFHHCITTHDQSTLDPGLDELKTICPHIGVVQTSEGGGTLVEELLSYSGL